MPQISELEKRERQYLIDIANMYYQESETQWLAVVRRVSKLRSLVKGDPADWYDRLGRRWLSAEQFPEYNKDTAPRYNHNINLSQGWWLILQGAVQTAGIPGSTFRPQNPREAEDVKAAEIGKTIIDYERTVMDFRELMMGIYRYFFTDGLCLSYTRHVKDKVKYGETMIPEEISRSVIITPASYLCPSCGATVPEEEVLPVPEMGIACPNCNSPLPPDSYLPPVEENQTEAIENPVANGREVVDLYGALEAFLPWWSKDLANAPYCKISTEVGREDVIAAFPELESDINGTGVDGSTVGPQARADARAPAGGYGAIMESNKVTYDRWWFRPQCFYRCGDMEVRKSLQKKYPNGLLFQLAGDVFLEAVPRRMEQNLKLMRCYKGDGMYPPSIGQSGVPIHDSINTAWNMALEAMEFAAFAPILLDSKVLSGQGMANRKMQPGVYVEVDLPAEKRLADSYVQMRIQDISTSVQKFIESALPWGEFLVGAEKVLQGGPITNVRTLGGQSQARSQALQRQACAYEATKEGIAGIQEQIVNEFLQNQNPETYFQVVGKHGTPQEMKIELSPDRGRIYAYPVASESVPQTWAQKQDTIEQLFSTQSEVVKSWLNSPKNARVIFDLLGVPELTAPSADMAKKYERIIQELIAGAPQQEEAVNQMTGAPEPIEVSSIRFDPVMDDAEVAVIVFRDWGTTDEAFALVNTPAFQNVRLFLQDAITYQMQQQAQLAAQSQPQPAQ